MFKIVRCYTLQQVNSWTTKLDAAMGKQGIGHIVYKCSGVRFDTYGGSPDRLRRAIRQASQRYGLLPLLVIVQNYGATFYYPIE